MAPIPFPSRRKTLGVGRRAHPRRTPTADLLEAPQARSRVEGRQSLEGLKGAIEHVRRILRGVPAARVKGRPTLLHYEDLRPEKTGSLPRHTS